MFTLLLIKFKNNNIICTDIYLIFLVILFITTSAHYYDNLLQTLRTIHDPLKNLVFVHWGRAFKSHFPVMSSDCPRCIIDEINPHTNL